MAKTTVAGLEKRVEVVEGFCTDLHGELDTLRQSTEEGFRGIKEWLSNGGGDGLSQKIAAGVMQNVLEIQKQAREEDREERRLQLQEKEERDREYGQRRDSDRIIEQASRDRMTRILIALIGVGAPIITVIATKIFAL